MSAESPDWLNLRNGVVVGFSGPYAQDGRYVRVGELPSDGGEPPTNPTEIASKLVGDDSGRVTDEMVERACLAYIAADLHLLSGAVDLMREPMRAAFESALAAQGQGEAVKQWPFVESPGEFTARLESALCELPLLGAVRNVLIENPPTLAKPASPAGVPDEVVRVAQHMAMAIEYIEKAYPDAMQLDRAPIMRNLRRWRDRLLAYAPSAPEGDGGAE